MPDRHSSPPRPCSMAATTTSSQTAPASARTMLPSTRDAVCWPTAPRSGRSACRRSPRSSRQQTPAAGCRLPVGAFRVQLPQHGDHLFGAGAGDHARATGPTRNVVSGASGTASATCAPAKSEPASARFMARNGSLTCYAAFIRHVRRLRGQRRRGSSGFQRRRTTGWPGWPIPASTTRRWIRCGSVASPETTAPSRSSPLQVLHSDNLPGMVTQFHRGDLRIRREETLGPGHRRRRDGDRRRLDPGRAGDLTGTAMLSPIAESGGARLEFRVTVQVRVPLVGGKLEKIIGTQLVELVAQSSASPRRGSPKTA